MAGSFFPHLLNIVAYLTRLRSIIILFHTRVPILLLRFIRQLLELRRWRDIRMTCRIKDDLLQTILWAGPSGVTIHMSSTQYV